MGKFRDLVRDLNSKQARADRLNEDYLQAMADLNVSRQSLVAAMQAKGVTEFYQFGTLYTSMCGNILTRDIPDCYDLDHPEISDPEAEPEATVVS